MRFRVLVYNVHGFRSGVRRVAEAVGQGRPDIALLNESKGRFRLRRFAAAMEMEVAGSGLRVLGGVTNAVLVRPPWSAEVRLLTPFSRTGSLSRRGAVAVRASRPGASVTAVAVHLGLSEEERARHAQEATDLIAGLDAPIVLGGDLNEGPDGKAAAWIRGRLWDAWPRAARANGSGETFPAFEPRARIDYLFVSEGVEVARCWLGAGPEAVAASDHLPLFADLELPED